MPPEVRQRAEHGGGDGLRFVDGDQRTAWVIARLFLTLNGVRLTFVPGEAVAGVAALASGAIDEPQFAAWFRARMGA